MELEFRDLEDRFYNAVSCLLRYKDGQDYCASFADLGGYSQKDFIKAFEVLDEYCQEAKDVPANHAITSQVGDTAMLFYMVQNPRSFMVAYTVKPEYLQYEQTFATCCKYFGADDVLPVFNAYFDYLETKRE